MYMSDDASQPERQNESDKYFFSEIADAQLCYGSKRNFRKFALLKSQRAI